MNLGNWKYPATVELNNFVYKSLSNWALNFAVGCGHACRFCYVPDASTNKLRQPLSAYGVKDPDVEWGDYVMLRPFDEKKFRASVKRANDIPEWELPPDGNRAVMLCSTTDAYQALKPPFMEQLNDLRRRCLEIILNESSLNVLILTRSPLAEQDFGLFKQFGKRLMFGMSIPTLRNDLARIYEPKAPAPTRRLETLTRASQHGINIYVAMAPTYPECDMDDLVSTLTRLKDIKPLTVFHEPINIRAKNVERIAVHAKSLGMELKTGVFATPRLWRDYAVKQLIDVESIARRIGLRGLHLWPDASLGTADAIKQFVTRGVDHYDWLQRWWKRKSEWPTDQVYREPHKPREPKAPKEEKPEVVFYEQ